MIGIVNYGLGNLYAFHNIYEALNIESRIVDDSDGIRRADHLILPGVGAFDDAVLRLRQSSFFDLLVERVNVVRIPVLGVCVGMQIMATKSDEGVEEGLSWVNERVNHFGDGTGCLPVPHMGWNKVMHDGNEPLFRGIDSGARFYFLHSYYFPENVGVTSIGWASYGERFCCSFKTGNVYGVQFHPEKSHEQGTRLLVNFASL